MLISIKVVIILFLSYKACTVTYHRVSIMLSSTSPIQLEVVYSTYLVYLITCYKRNFDIKLPILPHVKSLSSKRWHMLYRGNVINVRMLHL